MLNYDRKVPDRKYIDTGWSAPEFFASHRTINHRYKLTIFDYTSDGCDDEFYDNVAKVRHYNTFFDDKYNREISETLAEDWLCSLVPDGLMNPELPRYDATYQSKRLRFYSRKDPVVKQEPKKAGSKTTMFKSSHNGISRSTLHAVRNSIRGSNIKKVDSSLVEDAIRLGLCDYKCSKQIKPTILGLQFIRLTNMIHPIMDIDTVSDKLSIVDDLELLTLVEAYVIASNWRLDLRNAVINRKAEIEAEQTSSSMAG